MSDKQWVALKFGGTSVSSHSTWKQIVRRATQLQEEGLRVWIVISALSKVTDTLGAAIDEALALADDREFESKNLKWIKERHQALCTEIGISLPESFDGYMHQLQRLLQGVQMTQEAGPRLRAKILAYGETLSVVLGEKIFESMGHPIQTVDLTDIFTSTFRTQMAEEDKYLEARVVPQCDLQKAEKFSKGNDLVLSPGFRCKTPKGDVALLGRGGSDTSAALVGAFLQAVRVEIWTDVHGIFSCDPRTNPEARLIKVIGNREAQELAAMGAKVLHPRCLTPAKAMGLPVEVRNTMDPDAPCTTITITEERESIIYGVSALKGTTLMTLSTMDMWGASGFLAKFFAPFESFGISVDQVATSQQSVSVTLDSIPGGVHGEAFARLQEALQPLGKIKVVHPCTVVSIVGHKIRDALHKFDSAFGSFANKSVLLVSASSDGVCMSFVVREEDATTVTQELHKRLIPSSENAIFGPAWSQLKH